jgi:folate-dependent phosphoribosylglycinamide formyltransferase PurN
MPTDGIAVFAYNFPHKKTQDFLFRLFYEGIPVDCVIACDPVELKVAPPSIRTKLRHTALVHPRQLAERLGAEYFVIPHNDQQVVDVVKERGVQLALIAGARILKKHIISAFPQGIINYHPGLIPQTRGLDAMMWSVHNDIPQALTAHLIDPRVDAGTILFVEEMPIWKDDTPFDFQLRLHEMQMDMIPRAVDMARKGEGTPVGEAKTHNTKMTPEQEAETLRRFPEYVKRRATK